METVKKFKSYIYTKIQQSNNTSAPCIARANFHNPTTQNPDNILPESLDVSTLTSKDFFPGQQGVNLPTQESLSADAPWTILTKVPETNPVIDLEKNPEKYTFSAFQKAHNWMLESATHSSGYITPGAEVDVPSNWSAENLGIVETKERCSNVFKTGIKSDIEKRQGALQPAPVELPNTLESLYRPPDAVTDYFNNVNNVNVVTNSEIIAIAENLVETLPSGFSSKVDSSSSKPLKAARYKFFQENLKQTAGVFQNLLSRPTDDFFEGFPFYESNYSYLVQEMPSLAKLMHQAELEDWELVVATIQDLFKNISIESIQIPIDIPPGLTNTSRLNFCESGFCCRLLASPNLKNVPKNLKNQEDNAYTANLKHLGEKLIQELVVVQNELLRPIDAPATAKESLSNSTNFELPLLKFFSDFNQLLFCLFAQYDNVKKPLSNKDFKDSYNVVSNTPFTLTNPNTYVEKILPNFNAILEFKTFSATSRVSGCHVAAVDVLNAINYAFWYYLQNAGSDLLLEKELTFADSCRILQLLSEVVHELLEAFPELHLVKKSNNAKTHQTLLNIAKSYNLTKQPHLPSSFGNRRTLPLYAHFIVNAVNSDRTPVPNPDEDANTETFPVAAYVCAGFSSALFEISKILTPPHSTTPFRKSRELLQYALASLFNRNLNLPRCLTLQKRLSTTCKKEIPNQQVEKAFKFAANLFHALKRQVFTEDGSYKQTIWLAGYAIKGASTYISNSAHLVYTLNTAISFGVVDRFSSFEEYIAALKTYIPDPVAQNRIIACVKSILCHSDELMVEALNTYLTRDSFVVCDTLSPNIKFAKQTTCPSFPRDPNITRIGTGADLLAHPNYYEKYSKSSSSFVKTVQKSFTVLEKDFDDNKLYLSKVLQDLSPAIASVHPPSEKRKRRFTVSNLTENTVRHGFDDSSPLQVRFGSYVTFKFQHEDFGAEASDDLRYCPHTIHSNLVKLTTPLELINQALLMYPSLRKTESFYNWLKPLTSSPLLVSYAKFGSPIGAPIFDALGAYTGMLSCDLPYKLRYTFTRHEHAYTQTHSSSSWAFPFMSKFVETQRYNRLGEHLKHCKDFIGRLATQAANDAKFSKAWLISLPYYLNNESHTILSDTHKRRTFDFLHTLVRFQLQVALWCIKSGVSPKTLRNHLKENWLDGVTWGTHLYQSLYRSLFRCTRHCDTFPPTLGSHAPSDKHILGLIQNIFGLDSTCAQEAATFFNTWHKLSFEHNKATASTQTFQNILATLTPKHLQDLQKALEDSDLSLLQSFSSTQVHALKVGNLLGADVLDLANPENLSARMLTKLQKVSDLTPAEELNKSLAQLANDLK